MTIEHIHESIEVISYFDGKKMRPLRFRWRGRAYSVKIINGVWSNPIGRGREYHFHVATKESGSFELICNNESLSWKVGRVCLED